MFYQNFVYLCEQLGVTRSNVCKKLGLSENAWKRWEEESMPRRSTIVAVSRFFGVAYDDLLHTDLRNKPKEEEIDSLTARYRVFDDPLTHILLDAADGAPPKAILEAAITLMKAKETNQE